MDRGRPSLLPLEDSHTTVPTVLFFHFDEHRVCYGREAINEYVTGADGRQMRSLKRILGSELLYEKTRLGKSSVALADVIGMFIRELKQRAENQVGDAIDNVVLGRPVKFVANDPSADARAQQELEAITRRAGFRQVEFEFEPIAAAMVYQSQLREDAIALIVDAGGGTSDFSIVELAPAIDASATRASRILASHGVRIGGTDFDAALALSSVMPLLGYHAPLGRGGTVMPSWIYGDLTTWQKVNFLYTHSLSRMVAELRELCTAPHLVDRLARVLRLRLGHYILMAVEGAKIDLTSQAVASCELDAIEENLRLSLTSADLENAIGREMQDIFDGVSETVRSAGLTPDRIEKIFTTGGSTAIPAIREWIEATFPLARIVEGDRFGSVGMGLALEAHRRFS